jgi:hypothetical protein
MGKPNMHQIQSDKIEKWNSYYREFSDKSDRAAAIVGAAMLEDTLEKVIRSHPIGKDVSGKKLRDFNAKIEEAYGLGLLADIQKQDLHTLREIRNCFAHELPAVSFEESNIYELCNNLQIGKRFLPIEHSPRQRFAATVAALMYSLTIQLSLKNETQLTN